MFGIISGNDTLEYPEPFSDMTDFSKDMKGSVKEPNMFHNYETGKITCKATDVAEYIELFISSARDRHAGRI